jgi:hypothetical protein
LSSGPCKPFDASRDGLSLGEGAGTIILTSNPKIVKNNGFISIIPSGAYQDESRHILEEKCDKLIAKCSDMLKKEISILKLKNEAESELSMDQNTTPSFFFNHRLHFSF